MIVEGLRAQKISHRGERYKFAGAPIEVDVEAAAESSVLVRCFNPGRAHLCRASSDADRDRRSQRDGQGHGGRHICELLEQFRDSPENLNPQIKEPKIGAVRHFLVADTDQAGGRNRYPGVSGLLPEHHQALARFRFGANAVYRRPQARDRGRCRYCRFAEVSAGQNCGLLEESKTNYLVLSFAWGGLTYAQSRHSLDLFASEVLPHFVKRYSKYRPSGDS